MPREKKFFFPIIRTYGNNLAKRWRVEYWTPGSNGEKDKRICIYNSINAYQCVDKRLEQARLIINSLDFKKNNQSNDILEATITRASTFLKKKTISSYTSIVRSLREFLKDKSLDNLTAAEFDDYILYLKRIGIKNTTLHNRRLSLHSLFNKAIEYGLIAFNPIEKTKSIKKQAASLMYFSDGQIKIIKDYCDNNAQIQLWLSIRLLFYCFIRPGEIRMMKISWINFDYGFIEIPGDHSKNGKTQKVAIPSQFHEEIMYLNNYPNNYYIISKNNTPGPVPISQNWINNQHRKMLDKLKIRGRYAFYSWKHTGVVKAVKAGINIKDLQLQLRHHSLDMVNEYLKNLGVMDSEDIRHKFPTL